MSALQVFEIVAIVAIVLAVAAGAGLILVYRKLQNYRHSQHVILGSRGTTDIVEHVAALDDKLANMRLALEDLTLAARDHDVRIDSSVSRVGIVRFDAYQDLGGRQSTTIALLSSVGDGVVITSVVSRDFARIYVKLLKEGTPDIPLAPEEQEAVEQARGSGPFTIRPRVEREVGDEVRNGTETVGLSVDAPLSTGIPGRRPENERELARENRRRRRKGLPLVEELVMPSATGWGDRKTPTPSFSNLAGQYVEERKAARKDASDTGDRSGISSRESEDGREL